MASDAAAAVDYDEELAQLAADLADDPLAYAHAAYPWGEGSLAGKDGPRVWQADIFGTIRDHLQGPRWNQPLLVAVASGHGIGKSAAISMVIDWAMTTAVDTKIVVTANTETQLRTKTWPEVSKWHGMSLFSSWMRVNGTSVVSTDKKHEKTWRCDAVPWSVHNTEAFAGLHNERKRIVLIFDEASNIADKVWEVAEGALTDKDTEIIWIAFGNPTRNTGRFRECFSKYKHRWVTRQIDARTVEGLNTEQHDKWVDDYGEDSDFVRVRVRGEFPSASDLQLIPSDWVAAGRRREAVYGMSDALVCGIDIARGGSDTNVVQFRRGMDARSIKPIKIPGFETRDTTKFIARVCTVVMEQRPDAVFVDSTGVGGPVADQLRRLLPGVPIIDVNFASSAPDAHYSNMRSYMWWKLREGLKSGLAIDDDPALEVELTAPEYTHNSRDQLQLEKKDDIKKRIGVSPDQADALALTYAMPVMKLQDQRTQTNWNPYDELGGSEVQTEWNPYA